MSKFVCRARRFVAVLLAVLMIGVTCTGVFASATEIVYYAEIQSFSAVYDRNTEKISFCIDFKGNVFDTHSFTVTVLCAERVNGTWGESTMFAIHTLLFSDCLTADNKLEGEVKVGKSYFLSEDYKDWTIVAAGRKLNTSIVSAEYYSMDSATAAVSLKATPSGDFYKLGGTVGTETTLCGDNVELTITMTDIVPELSEGLREFSFDIYYNSTCMRPHSVSYSFPENGGWALDGHTAATDKLSFEFSGTVGLEDDGDFTVTVVFETVAAGRCEFAVRALKGADAYANEFENVNGYTVCACTVTEASASSLKGDVNGDGKVNSLDAARILKFDAGILTEISSVGDVNGDGKVNSLDAARILKFDAHVITEL